MDLENTRDDIVIGDFVVTWLYVTTPIDSTPNRCNKDKTVIF